MYRNVIKIFAAFVIATTFLYCNSSASDKQSATEQEVTDSSTVQSDKQTAEYKCPMKCEGEKAYDKPGKCPECDMDLAKIE